MFYLFFILIPPVIVVLVMKVLFQKTITGREFAVQFSFSVMIATVVFGVSQYSALYDTEIRSGKVTGKEKEWTSCSHSYECRCRTEYSGTGKNRTSRRVCDTCYEHNNDWDWVVHTTLGDFEIDRIDRRGSYEPQRWTIVQPNQPVAKEYSYINYVRAAPESLFHVRDLKSFKGKLPDYPSIEDYQYANRVIAMGVKVPNLADWNTKLAVSLNDLAAAKQVNYVVVMTNGGPDFSEALRAHWLGGKKNDVIVVIGTDYPTIKWVRVFSWAEHDIVNVSLRNDLMDSKTLDSDRTIGIITKNITQYYQRKPMEDFKYLADQAQPSMWVMVIAMILSTAAAVGFGIYFHNNVCFE